MAYLAESFLRCRGKSQVLPSQVYGRLNVVALLVGRTEDIRPVQVPAPRIDPARHGLTAQWVLVGLPVMVFAIPAFLGHPVMPTDDLTQNYPLRVLVGAQLRSGRLPLFDPYIWSGAPLLGGWNAGAAYPFTLLFAVMSGTAAWTINLIVTWWVAGLGTFAFLRASRLSRVASFLGGLSFAFAGAMAAQTPHFGLVAGMSWVPVALLALLRLSEHRVLRRCLAWMLVLTGSIAMVIVAGEPRAIDDAVVVLTSYALWRALRLVRPSGRLSYAVFVLAGASLGVAIGAVQWLPGFDAVQTSQRASHSAALFASGSLAPKWLFLSIVPDLLGGSGSFGQPTFFGPYSLAEITGYVGLMPLAAALALLGRVRLRRPLPEWVIWHIMAIVGVLLALGSNTVLGPTLMHLPLFGGQRLQSRNIVIADLALAILLAYWADLWLKEGRLARRRLPSTRQLLGVIPGLATVVVVTLTLLWGAGMLRWLGLSPSMANQAGPLKPWLVPFLVLGGLTIALLVWGQRLGRRRRAHVLVGLVALDIAIFSVLTLVSVAPGLTRSQTPVAASPGTSAVPGAGVSPSPRMVPLPDLVGGGRFAVYDPDLFDGGQLAELGVPDSNVLSETPSVEGYSSLVDGTYAQGTGSHQALGEGQNVLDPKAIADGTLDQLDTTVLLTLPTYLVTSSSGAPRSTDGATGRRELTAQQTATWYLGTGLVVRSVSLSVDAAADEKGIRVGLVEESGSTLWEPPRELPGHGVEVSLTRPQDIVALRVRAGATTIDLGAPDIQTAGGGTIEPTGSFKMLWYRLGGHFAASTASLPSSPIPWRVRHSRFEHPHTSRPPHPSERRAGHRLRRLVLLCPHLRGLRSFATLPTSRGGLRRGNPRGAAGPSRCPCAGRAWYRRSPSRPEGGPSRGAMTPPGFGQACGCHWPHWPWRPGSASGYSGRDAAGATSATAPVHQPGKSPI